MPNTLNNSGALNISREFYIPFVFYVIKIILLEKNDNSLILSPPGKPLEGDVSPPPCL